MHIKGSFQPRARTHVSRIACGFFTIWASREAQVKVRVTIYSLDILLFQVWTVHFSMSSSNCCFLSCIQVSQEAGKVVWYSHLFKNIPQFVVIHTVKGFRVLNEAEIDVGFFRWGILLLFLWSRRCWQFFSLIPLLFLNPPCTSKSSQFTYCWSLAWRILSVILLA